MESGSTSIRRTIPLPGYRTVAHVEENVAAMEAGPLTEAQIREIRRILTDTTGA